MVWVIYCKLWAIEVYIRWSEMAIDFLILIILFFTLNFGNDSFKVSHEYTMNIYVIYYKYVYSDVHFDI